MIKSLSIAILLANGIIVPTALAVKSDREKFFALKSSPLSITTNYGKKGNYFLHSRYHVLEAVRGIGETCFFGVPRLPYRTGNAIMKTTEFYCFGTSVLHPGWGGTIGLGNLELPPVSDVAQDLAEYPEWVLIQYVK